MWNKVKVWISRRTHDKTTEASGRILGVESFLCRYDGVLTDVLLKIFLFLFYFFDFLFLIKDFIFGCPGCVCCTWALSSHGKSGLLSSCDVKEFPLLWVSLVAACGLWAWASAVVEHGFALSMWLVESSQTGNQTPVSCIDRWTLKHGTTRKSVITDFLKTTGLMSPWPPSHWVDAL